MMSGSVPSPPRCRTMAPCGQRAAPLPESLQVQVNGITSTSWALDPDGQTLVFEAEAAPVIGDDVRFRYASSVACE